MSKIDFSGLGALITPPTTDHELIEELTQISTSKKSTGKEKKEKSIESDLNITDEELKALLAKRGYKADLIETKSKRLNLLIQPSVYEKAKELSLSKGVSINSIVETALKKYIEEESI